MNLAKLLQNNNLKIESDQIVYSKMRVTVSSSWSGLKYRFTDMPGNLLFEFEEHEMKTFVNKLKKLLDLSKIEIKK